MWETKLFYWTGYLLWQLAIIVLLLGSIYLSYLFWNEISKGYSVMFKCMFFHMKYGKNIENNLNRTYTNKKGKTYKIVEVKS